MKPWDVFRHGHWSFVLLPGSADDSGYLPIFDLTNNEQNGLLPGAIEGYEIIGSLKPELDRIRNKAETET